MKQSGKSRVTDHMFTHAISPSSQNAVVQTAGSMPNTNRNESDLQRAIADYQNKSSKKQMSGKPKGTQVRSSHKTVAATHEMTKHGQPFSSKKIADTYMVGGCSVDLNASYQTQKKLSVQVAHTQKNFGVNSGNQTSHKAQASYGRQRQTNQNSKSLGTSGGGPMQLEPNPVFSIVEEQMEKMNRRTAEREEAINSAAGRIENDGQNDQNSKQDRQGGSEQYVSFVDSTNVVQLQKMVIQSSFSSGQNQDYLNDDDQIVAYSQQRKTTRTSKTNAKKTSPKNSFINHANQGDLTNVWSKYRRNMNELLQKSGPTGKSQSLSRQDYLLTQHKMKQQMQIQTMQEKVNDFQKKLQSEGLQQPDPFSMRNINKKDRFSKSQVRESYALQRRSSNQNLEGIPVSSKAPKGKQGKPFSTSTTAAEHQQVIQSVLDGDLINIRQNETQDGRERKRSSLNSERPSVGTKRNSSQNKQSMPATGAGQQKSLNNSMLMNSYGKNSALNGKVSTSLKTTWTVNRSSGLQNLSRLANQTTSTNGDAPGEIEVNRNKSVQRQRDSPNESGVQISQQSQDLEKLHQSDSERGRRNKSTLRDETVGKQSSTSQFASRTQKPQTLAQIHMPTSPKGASKTGTSNGVSNLVAQRKKTANSSSYQQVVSSTHQMSQLANRRRFMKEGSASGKAQISVQAARNGGIQEVITSPLQQSLINNSSANHRTANESTNQTGSGASPQHKPTKRRKSGQKSNFEQLMTAGSRAMSPTKQPKETQPVQEETKVKESATQVANIKQNREFKYQDPNVKIGNGKFGPVNLIIHKGKLLALKVIPKTTIDKTKRIEHVKNEKFILQLLRKNARDLESGASQRVVVNRSTRQEDMAENEYSQNKSGESASDKEPLDFIMMLYDTFVDDDNVNFVFEYLPGQDLFWILSNEHNLKLGDNMRRKIWVLFYCSEILCALSTLHSKHIIYRDMKPDNVMIDYEGHIKLIDFGFAKQLSQKQGFRTRTNCGTIGYTAPEILLGSTQGYSYGVDIWSFGIMMAELLSGSLPFLEKDDPMKLQEQILAGQIKLNKPGIDMEARDLLAQIFLNDPEMRPSIDKIKKHRLFMNDQPADYWTKIQSKSFQEPPYKPNPLKYAYLLQNEYPVTSNLDKQRVASRSNTPSIFGGQEEMGATEAIQTQQPESNTREVSPSPEFGGRGAANSSALDTTKAFRLGDAIGVKGARPVGVMREMNVGLFGRGGGDFDARGNMKNSPNMFDQSPSTSLEQKKDFYSVNADIAIEANQQQRNFEYGQRAGMIQQEYQSMGMSGNMDESQQQDEYNGLDPMQQQDLMQQQQMQLVMLDETMNGPQAVRYDEVYYPRTDKRSIRGNQYTYKGNEHYAKTNNAAAVNSTVNNAIDNQEIGKSPIEYTNQLSRAKVFDMKGMRVQDQVRSYNNLYQDSIPMSSQHELQRYGKRAPGLDASKRVNKATFMNQIVEKQQIYQYQQQHQHQQQVEPVHEEQNQEQDQEREEDAGDQMQPRNQIPGGDDDDVSGTTEVAEAPGNEENLPDTEWKAIVDALWSQYDADNSGYLDKQEMRPLAQAALAQVGYGEEIDQSVCDAFFAEVDNDGNGKIDKEELMKFMKSLMS